tara:strand:+ start:312 stop:893 length:582 start_codon:yes stop_codon:yes gene_type:complete
MRDFASDFYLEPQEEKYSATLPDDLRKRFAEGLFPFTKKVFDVELKEHRKDIEEFGNIPNDEREKEGMYTDEEVEALEKYQHLWNRATSSGIGAPWPANNLEILLEMLDKVSELIDEHLGELWFALKDLEKEHDRPMEEFIEYKMFLIMKQNLSTDREFLQHARSIVKRIYLNLRTVDLIGKEQALAHIQEGE